LLEVGEDDTMNFNNKRSMRDEDFWKKNEEECDLDKASKVIPMSIVVSQVMGKLDPDGEMSVEGLSLGAVQQAWNEVAGEQIAEITRSVYLRNDQVIVVLNSAVWAQELGFFSEEYSKKMNDALEVDSIKEVKFRVR